MDEQPFEKVIRQLDEIRTKLDALPRYATVWDVAAIFAVAVIVMLWVIVLLGPYFA